MCRRRLSSGIGGENIVENIEGRERYPVNVRYEQDFRGQRGEDADGAARHAGGDQIPLGQVARISFSPGPSMIRDEDGQLTGYIYIDLKDYELRSVCGGCAATAAETN